MKKPFYCPLKKIMHEKKRISGCFGQSSLLFYITIQLPVFIEYLHHFYYIHKHILNSSHTS